MKNTFILSLAALAAGAAPGIAAEYSTFRVCEDTRIIRTSDGADAGRVQYIVVDPSNQRVISTIVTGGVVGEKFVAVPFSAMRFDASESITLTEITRERIVSAPAMERTQITAVIQPDTINRTYQHFGVRTDGSVDVNVRQDNQREDPNRTRDVREDISRMRNDRMEREANEAAAREENARRNASRSDKAKSPDDQRQNRRDRDARPSSDRNRSDENNRPDSERDRANEQSKEDRSDSPGAGPASSPSGNVETSAGSSGATQTRESTDGRNAGPETNRSDTPATPSSSGSPAASGSTPTPDASSPKNNPGSSPGRNETRKPSETPPSR